MNNHRRKFLNPLGVLLYKERTNRLLANDPCLKMLIAGVLGAFARWRRANVSFVISVCPSLRIEQLGSHWTDIHEI